MLSHGVPAMYFAGAGLTPLFIYIGAIIAFFLSVAWRPHVGIYFLIPLLPLQTVRYLLHPLPFGEKLVDFVLLGVIIGLMIQKKGRLFPNTALNGFLIFWAVFHYVSLWRGAFYLGGDLPFLPTDPRFSVWKNYMVMPLIFIVVAAAIKEKRQMQILLLLMAFTVLRTNIGFHNTVSERDFSHFSYGLRYAGTLGYAGENGLAAFEAQLALFCLAMCVFTRNIAIKASIYGFIALCLYCLLFAFSRGGYLGFMSGIFFLGCVKDRKLLVIFVTLVLSWQALVPTAVTERIFMTYNDEGQIDSSAGERVTIWEDAVTLVPQNPIFGTGFNTYEYMGRVEEYKDTHNIYLKILVETGCAGVILFLLLLWKSFRMSYRLFKVAEDPFFRAIGLGTAAYLFCAFVVNFFGDRWMYLQVNGYLWTFLGLVARAHIIHKEQAEAAEEAALPAEHSDELPALAPA
ncbi:MAG TPA: O-antigen ligase family protein [Candidatus Angelobacter sp.]|nr:O-antigen ligase family protein [Candidatus Angelobacter sp.]